MTKIYVAAPGITIPGGWPDEGRAINPISSLHHNMVRDGDLVLKPAETTKSKPVSKKEDADGK